MTIAAIVGIVIAIVALLQLYQRVTDLERHVNALEDKVDWLDADKPV